jgi:glycosyltransferase involved in cell wall biosynthesis
LLSNEAKALDIPQILFLARDNDETSQGVIRYTIDVPHNLLSFTRLPTFLIGSIAALREIYLMKEKITVIFPMPSPLDLIPRIFFRLANRRTISIIHDPIKHSGEIFPFKLYTHLVGKLSSELVFLSNFAKNQFIKNFSSGSKVKSKVIGHPPLLIGEVSKLPEEEQGYYLCLGRLVKYKGIENLMKVFPEVDPNDRNKLIVIGSGSSINISGSKQIEIHNTWMTNEQFLKMIANSGIVLLPYIEATQSGIIPIIQMLKNL